MRKSKKILFLIAGIFNCVIGALGLLVGGIMLVLQKIIRLVFDSTSGMTDEFVKDLAEVDSEYSYLLSASKDEVLDFIMHIVTIMGLVIFVIGIIWAVFGVINILLTSITRYNKFESKKWYKVTFLIFSWVLLMFNVANILTTVAVCLKDKDKVENTLYSAKDNS